MAASVLNSQGSVDSRVLFSQCICGLSSECEKMLASHGDLSRNVDALEKTYDARFRVVFDAIRALMEPPKTPRRRIGF